MWQIVQRLLNSGVNAKRLWWFRLDHPILMQFNLDGLIRPVLAESGGDGGPARVPVPGRIGIRS